MVFCKPRTVISSRISRILSSANQGHGLPPARQASQRGRRAHFFLRGAKSIVLLRANGVAVISSWIPEPWLHERRTAISSRRPPSWYSPNVFVVVSSWSPRQSSCRAPDHGYPPANQPSPSSERIERTPFNILLDLINAPAFPPPGLPHPSLFPFSSITAQVYPSNTFVDPVSCQPPEDTLAIHISKVDSPTPTAPLNLTTSLQYGACRSYSRYLRI